MASRVANASKAWREIRALNPPSPRSSHQLSSLGSRIYLFGGETGPLRSHFGYGIPVASTAVHWLDLATPKSWNEVVIGSDSGPPPSARLGHGQAIVNGNGSAFLYVFGGRQPEEKGDLGKIRSLNDMHRLNLATGCWEELRCTGDVPSVRSYLQMVSLQQTLFVFGGMINEERYSDLYAFDTATNHWTRLPDAPMEGRGGAGVCVTGEGDGARLWVVAGFCGRPVSDVWEYSIAAQVWRAREDLALPVARSIFACGAMTSDPRGTDTEICLFGGEVAPANGDGEAGKYSSETLVLRSGVDEKEGCGVHLVPATESPAARGWTSGCVASMEGGKTGFVIFGGIKEGEEGQPPGVRLGDLAILE